MEFLIPSSSGGHFRLYYSKRSSLGIPIAFLSLHILYSRYSGCCHVRKYTVQGTSNWRNKAAAITGGVLLFSLPTLNGKRQQTGVRGCCKKWRKYTVYVWDYSQSIISML